MLLRGFLPGSARVVGVRLGLCCGVLLGGCPQQSNCADPANAAACGFDQTASIEASSRIVRVVQGEQTSVEITLDWPDAFDQAATLEAEDTPSGVDIEPLTVESQAQSATMLFGVSSDAEHGIYPIRIVATFGSTPVEASVELVVAGVPGAADTSFSYDGETGYGTLDEHYLLPRVVTDAQGRMLVTGERTDLPPYIIRLNPDASVDTAFSENLARHTTDTGVFLYTDVFVDADERIISLGWFRPEADVIHGLIERRDSAGNLDPSFGDNGRIIVAEDYSASFGLTHLMPRKDDFVVLYEDSAYAYLPSGERNSAFGDGGYIGSLPGYSSPFGVLLPDDNILWLAQKTVDDGALISNEGKSVLDTDVSAFRAKLTAHYDYCFYFRTNYCHFDSDQKIVCPGRYSNDPDPDSDDDDRTGHAFLVRMNHQGEFDATFGEGGLVVRPGAATSNSALAILKNGKILVSEYDEIDEDGFLAYLGLYNSDGSIDDGFGNNGRVAVPVYTLNLNVDETYGRVTFVGVKDDRLIIARRWL